MSRTPRVIVANRAYEIVTRARYGLPFPPTRTTKILLKGILGRVQRDVKVILGHAMIVNNHNHQIVQPKRPEDFCRYYGEMLKKATEALKALLGQTRLRIWEDRATVMMLESLEDCINRIVYLYCNPAKHDLEDSVDKYPGFNTWREFLTCEPSVEATVTLNAKWYPVKCIPKLPASRVLDAAADDRYAGRLCATEEGEHHPLVVQPFAFLAPYGITEPAEIERIRQKIISLVREREAQYRQERAAEGRRVIGAARLCLEPYMKAHTPKKRERKIFLICHDRERRKHLLSRFRKIFEKCNACYSDLKLGNTVEWPPGTFTPHFAPTEFYHFSSA